MHLGQDDTVRGRSLPEDNARTLESLVGMMPRDVKMLCDRPDVGLAGRVTAVCKRTHGLLQERTRV